MEKELVLKWLNGSGYGYGDGSGSGYGSGSSYGSGSGYGYSDGSGYGDGDGYGSGYGDGSGDGSGDGDGDGYGSGYGYGDGSGYGDGDGYGSGYGYGDGSGDGEKLIKVKGYDIYYIDEVPTIITSIFGNYAKGFTVGSDYQLSSCFIAKDQFSGYFAHGQTLEEATTSLQEKITENMTTEERIQAFVKVFNKDEKYKGTEFFKWHNILTGSCLFGRNQFVKDNDLDLEQEYTVKDFINIVKNAYGGSVIKELLNYYN